MKQNSDNADHLRQTLQDKRDLIKSHLDLLRFEERNQPYVLKNNTCDKIHHGTNHRSEGTTRRDEHQYLFQKSCIADDALANRYTQEEAQTYRKPRATYQVRSTHLSFIPRTNYYHRRREAESRHYEMKKEDLLRDPTQTWTGKIYFSGKQEKAQCKRIKLVIMQRKRKNKK